MMAIWDSVKEAAGFTPIGLAYKGGKAIYDGVSGAVKPARGDPGMKSKAVGAVDVNQDPFNPLDKNPHAKDLLDLSNTIVGNASNMSSNKGSIGRQDPVSAPTIQGPDPIQGAPNHNVNPITPGTLGPMDLGRTDQGINAAGSAIQSSMGAPRQGQVGSAETLAGFGRGENNIAQSLFDANQARSAGTMMSAGAQAARAMGMGNAAAQGSYLDSSAQAQNQIRNNTESAILANAALAAGARGSNVGMALRGAQNNAATQTQAGIRQATEQQAAANRAAFAANNQANLQAAGALEQANIQAANNQQVADLQALAQGQQFQLQGAGMATDAFGNIRAGDIGAANAAIGMGNLSLGADNAFANNAQTDIDRQMQGDIFNQQMGLAGAQFNADNNFRTDTFNANMNFNTQTANQGSQLATNNLTVGDNTIRDIHDSNMMFGRDKFRYDLYGMGAGIQQGLVGMDVNAGIQGETLGVSSAENARNRALDIYLGDLGIASNNRGQNIQLFGAGLNAAGGIGGAAAMASDRRLKKKLKKGYGGGGYSDEDTKEDIDEIDVPDFRSAKNYEYSYIDPSYEDGRAGTGRHAGPMAQELPDDAVFEGEDGFLRVPPGELALQLAPAMGDAQRRLDKLESMLGLTGTSEQMPEVEVVELDKKDGDKFSSMLDDMLSKKGKAA